jgi:hypothetical protein
VNPASQLVAPFKNPARYALYGGTANGVMARIAGSDTLAEIGTLKTRHAKSYPNMTYRVFEATWKEIK